MEKLGIGTDILTFLEGGLLAIAYISLTLLLVNIDIVSCYVRILQALDAVVYKKVRKINNLAIRVFRYKCVSYFTLMQRAEWFLQNSVLMVEEIFSWSLKSL